MSPKKTTEKNAAIKENYDDLLNSVVGIARDLQALSREAVNQYTPIVNDIIRSNSRDINRIERTLDELVGFCADTHAVEIYRKLCRHYWQIDPAAAAEYVKLYRDIWEP